MTERTEPTYDELGQRLAHAEAALEALRTGQVDTIVGDHGTLVVRLAEAEAREAHIKQVLLGIRSINQMIVKENDPKRLIARACVTLTETMGYYNARIVLLDLPTDVSNPPLATTSITTVAFAFEDGFEGLCQHALRGAFPACIEMPLDRAQTVVIEDPKIHCPDCLLASTYGGHAVLARRLSFADKTYGVLVVSLQAHFVCDEEEQDLFNELADDLAFALHKIDAAQRLREGERRYREIFEGSRDGCVMVDVDGRIMDANQSYCAMLGYSLDELRGLSDFYQITPQRWHEWEKTEIWEKCLVDQGYSVVYEKEYIRRDGVIFPVELQSYVVRREDGAINYLWGVARDITERKQQAERIAVLGQMLDEAPASVTIHDTDGHFLYANRETLNLHGYPDEASLLALNLKDVDVPESRLLLAERFRLIEEDGEASFEVAHYRKDGSAFPLHVLAKKIIWRGKPAILSVATDITERKQADEALHKRESQLEKIFEILPIGLWFADKAGRLLRGNPMGVKIWGAEPLVPISEYGVFKAWRLPSREPLAPDDWALAKTVRNGVTIVDELLEIEALDGTRKTILNYTAPVLDADGQVDGAIVVNLDISDRVALEAQLNQSQKLESVGRLAGGVAHDFNNMLNVILGHADLALEELADDHPLRADLTEIQKAALRSADLTRQLLAFARRQTVAPRILNLNDMIESMLKMLGRLIGENVKLTWKPARSITPMRIDPAQIDQILVNLIVNARDAIGPGVGNITIETGQVFFDERYCASYLDFSPGHYVKLTVSDDGCGMDEATRSQIFEPFFTTKGVGEGTGLGLATVYGVVKQNNGHVTVHSEVGQGTIFTIYLPVQGHAEAPPAANKAQPAPQYRGDETILLVEDEPVLLLMTAKMLERQGYRVLTASTPRKALQLAAEHTGEIHLLITDVVMPEMNGCDLAQNLISTYPQIKRLFMSGYAADIIANQDVLAQRLEFIQKPFSKQGLAKKVREVLDA